MHDQVAPNEHPPLTHGISNLRDVLTRGLHADVIRVNGEEVVGASNITLDNRHYIASEAPLDPALFFKMMAEQESDLFVSLTQEREHEPPFDNGIRKNNQVFIGRGSHPLNQHHLPEVGENKEFSYSDNGLNLLVTVQTTQEIPTDLDGATLRKAVVTCADGNTGAVQAREVTQLDYDKWPDTLMPEDHDDLRDLVKLLNRHSPDADKRITVNCMMGLGRTNTLIVQHQMMNEGVNGNPDRADELIGCLRKQIHNRYDVVQKYLIDKGLADQFTITEPQEEHLRSVSRRLAKVNDRSASQQER